MLNHLIWYLCFNSVQFSCSIVSDSLRPHELQHNAFKLWCWRRVLWVPWTARRSNQSILNEISPGCYWKDWCWSWNSNTLVTSCEELTHVKRPGCWERLRAGGEGDDREWDGWMASPTQWTWVWVNSGSWWWTVRPGVLWFMGLQSQTRLRDWTELKLVSQKKKIKDFIIVRKCPLSLVLLRVFTRSCPWLFLAIV